MEHRDSHTGKNVPGRLFRIALHVSAVLAGAGLVWLVASILAVALYVFARRGPGDVPVAYRTILIVSLASVALALMAAILRRRLTLSRATRRSAWLSAILGVPCAVLSLQAAPARWTARENLPPESVLPVVYNKGYNISLLGFEKKTSFETHRYALIYDGLVDAGVTSRSTVVVPREASDDELLLVHTPDWLRRTNDPTAVAGVFETGIIASLPPRFLRERIVAPFRMQARGTALAAQIAIERGLGRHPWRRVRPRPRRRR